MIDNIKKLNASVGGYMGHSFVVEIDFEKALAEYKVFDRGYVSKSSKTLNLSSKKMSDFVQVLDKIKIIEWKKDYPNPGIMDGTNWGIEIKFDNNKKLISSGDNAFPAQWETFCKSIQKLLGKGFG